jgi:hypothetical protein
MHTSSYLIIKTGKFHARFFGFQGNKKPKAGL